MEQALYELPKGWSFPQLGSIAKLVGGATPSKKEKKYWNGNIKWASVRDLNVDDLVHAEYRITDEGLKSCSSNIIPKGNLVIATRVGLGKVSHAKVDVAINQDLRGVIPSSDIEVDYLFFWFKQKAEFIVSCGTGATVKGVKIDFIKSLKIPLPPLNEQKRIVAKLDALFTRIDTAITHLQQTLELSKTLFASALDEQYKQLSGLYHKKEIGGVVRIVSGYAFKSSDFSPSGKTRSVKITNVGLSGFVENDGGYLPDEFTEKYNRFAVEAGDIVIALTRSIINGGLKACRVTKGYQGALVNQRVAALARPVKDGCLGFLYWYLKTSAVFHFVLDKSRSLNQPNFSIKDLNGLSIPWPPLLVQGKTVTHIDALSERTRTLEATTQEKLNHLTALKASLLDAAFKGQL